MLMVKQCLANKHGETMLAAKLDAHSEAGVWMHANAHGEAMLRRV